MINKVLLVMGVFIGLLVLGMIVFSYIHLQ
jgi:hypothetical protein